MSAGLTGLLAVQGVWLAAGVAVALDVPPQILGGEGPLLRPAYDLLADLRAGPTGDALRAVREVQRSIEETARQRREAVGVG